VAAAALDSSIKTRDEARARWDKKRSLRLGLLGSFSREDESPLRLQFYRYYYEVLAGQEVVRAADVEVKEAESALELYQIRSVVRGVIRVVYKQPAEAVHALEPVFRIEPLQPPR
jgi:hypothetical protein